MKKWVFKLENILLVLPIAFVVFSELLIFDLGDIVQGNMGNEYLNIFTLQLMIKVIGWTLFILIPYSLYYLLRKKGLYSKRVAWIHTIISVLTFSLILLQFDFATSVVPGWHTTVYPLYYFAFSAENSLPFIIVQVVFVLYCVRKLAKATG